MSETVPWVIPAEHRVLLLRTCSRVDGRLRAYQGWEWPDQVGAVVTAPDWSPTAKCGYGLHGLLWGEGSADHLNWTENGAWMAIEADAREVIDLDGKVKVPRCIIRHIGDRATAGAFLQEHGGRGRRIHGATATAGDDGTATAGARGTATAGAHGTATAGARGTATAGYAGTATAGDDGTATAGARGTATAGYAGTATAGDDGLISIRWWDGRAGRYRMLRGFIGQDGLEPNVPYRVEVVDGGARWKRADPPAAPVTDAAPASPGVV